jgi:hypothetical protein
VVGETQWRWLSNGVLEYKVNGGAVYHQALWDHSGDTKLMVNSWFGVPVNCVLYEVERNQLDESHQIVLYNPVRTYNIIGTLLITLFFPSSRIQRMNPIVTVGKNQYAVYTVTKKDGQYTTIARANKFFSATVSTEVLEMAFDRFKNVKGKGFGMETVRRVLADNGEIDFSSASLIANYVVDSEGGDVPERPNASFNAVQYGGFESASFEQTPNPPTTMQQIAEPLTEAYFPFKTQGNLEAAYKFRVKDMLSDTPLEPWMTEYMHEFLSFMPKYEYQEATYQELLEAQPKPTQRNILYTWLQGLVTSICTSGQAKVEASPKVVDPRLIVSMTPELKAIYSTMCMGLNKMLKQFNWYAFGKQPSEIAERVSNIASTAQYVVKTDYSRWDGTVSPAIRALEKMVWQRFNPDAIPWHALQSKQPMRLGTKKVKNFSNRLSGSPETACLNSIMNAFIAFCHLRNQELCPLDAWWALGVYGGDDGLTVISNPAEKLDYENLAASFGLKLKCEVVVSGETGVEFLSRIYCSQVWAGHVCNTATLCRACAKLHLAVNTNLTAKQKAIRYGEKAFAYYLSDRNTPGLGVWAEKVHSITRATTLPSDAYGRDTIEEHQYSCFRDCAEEIVSYQCARDKFDLSPEINDWNPRVYNVTVPPQLIIKHTPGPQSKNPVIIDGELVGSEGVDVKMKTLPDVPSYPAPEPPAQPPHETSTLNGNTTITQPPVSPPTKVLNASPSSSQPVIEPQALRRTIMDFLIPHLLEGERHKSGPSSNPTNNSKGRRAIKRSQEKNKTSISTVNPHGQNAGSSAQGGRAAGAN